MGSATPAAAADSFARSASSFSRCFLNRVSEMGRNCVEYQGQPGLTVPVQHEPAHPGAVERVFLAVDAHHRLRVGDGIAAAGDETAQRD